MTGERSPVASMARWAAIGVMMAAVAGCSNPLQDEKDRLEMVMKSGSVDDVCRQSRKVAEAALLAKSPEYAELQVGANIHCMTAEQNPGESYDQATNSSATRIEADNLDAIIDSTAAPVPAAKKPTPTPEAPMDGITEDTDPDPTTGEIGRANWTGE